MAEFSEFPTWDISTNGSSILNYQSHPIYLLMDSSNQFIYKPLNLSALPKNPPVSDVITTAPAGVLNNPAYEAVVAGETFEGTGIKHKKTRKAKVPSLFAC